ncbi:PhzF family phenazine biosynthesis protein [Burkholderia vietnamiensis]|jgi:PhzF family phenazine biosynthesis protein|uniref:PhzF family phenazine biosynthesis protein n=1 Tax=Burkholderia vietnamiensis TaxID=60552 RepID=A0AA44XZR4_BURVI|nr:PhzF family phenazine biosynthesis protein [Burkholderia vietnamiensis]AOK00913.1 phenazine biosynthesis, PhzF family protein [Burkholderia vietnamiensis]KVF38068.1 phenazine biosynthesis, PhzF family protein [Burkholderia vietnamiensis]KVG06584.1 phenazine biosynthesis, PhzF family protein [Burkholderia vietnamiensis]KVR80669.1 phenazine biosynthesis, PhzF family protein [Burkholderia vietnamiensis]KVR96419.1 phenazine biosynthesis, PhzF family protein [Burkholderia vietnamiensis]
MTGRRVRFKQVDVFTSVPFKGNPLAVVFDADSLGDDDMLTIARWTNLSETTFVCTPSDPQADYRVRIFTPGGELPFAGHPTLGTAHAFLESGARPRTPGRLIQQCGVGRVELREQPDGWAFAAPPARFTPLDRSDYPALAAALRSDAIDPDAEPCAVDNGAPWLVVRLTSADACVGLAPDPAALAALTHRYGTHGLAAYAPHPDGGPATFEIRCLMSGGGFATGEDPVTGSANAALAGLLSRQQRRPGASYTARQGTAIGRDGRIAVRYDDDGMIWIGGNVVTIVDGTFSLPA